MPVVTSHPCRALPLYLTAALFFAASFVLLIGILIRRRIQRNNSAMSASSHYEFQAPEKEPLMSEQDQEADLDSQYQDKSALSVPPGPIPQTHQQSEPHSFPPPPPFPEPTISPYQEPEEFEGEPMIFTSFEQAIAVDLPRRRSYTKTTTGEAQVAGEIVVDPSAGWRRHTKVFGGGVCIACEENERRMSA